MRYIGNKQKLLQFIEETIKEFEPDLKDKTFCDLFSGTATVATTSRRRSFVSEALSGALLPQVSQASAADSWECGGSL